MPAEAAGGMKPSLPAPVPAEAAGGMIPAPSALVPVPQEAPAQQPMPTAVGALVPTPVASRIVPFGGLSDPFSAAVQPFSQDAKQPADVWGDLSSTATSTKSSSVQVCVAADEDVVSDWRQHRMMTEMPMNLPVRGFVERMLMMKLKWVSLEGIVQIGRASCRERV